MKKTKFLYVAVIATLTITGCQKPETIQPEAGFERLIAASHYSNSQLIHAIKHDNLADRELLGVLIAASPLDDNIIKEVLKAQNNVPEKVVQPVLLRNYPFSDHILKEILKDRNEIFDLALLGSLQADDLPDMELGDANYMMEALLNAKYGDAASGFDKIEMRSETVQVQGSLKSGDFFVLAQQIFDKLNFLQTRCESLFNSITLQCASKHIRAVDLEITTDKNPYTGDKVFDITVTVIVGVKTGAALPSSCSFGPTDYWLFSNNNGGCNINPATTSSAELETRDRLNDCSLLIAFCNTFFTDIEFKSFFYQYYPNPNDITPNDNYYDYLVFVNISILPNFHDCLEPDEMNFYTGNIEPLAKDSTPPGKHIISFWVSASSTFSSPPATLKIQHIPIIEYGKCQGATFK